MAVKRKNKLSAKKSKQSKSTASALNLKPITQKQTKVQIFKAIAAETGLTLGQVRTVFTMAGHYAKCHIMKRGSGEFAIPEMAVKIVRKTKPATKARQGRNPATGEEMTIAAKPKREVIKVRPLKSLKEVLMQG